MEQFSDAIFVNYFPIVIVHQKLKIMSSFTHSQNVLNPWVSLIVEHKIQYFEEQLLVINIH